jgi:hypothetical protein
LTCRTPRPIGPLSVSILIIGHRAASVVETLESLAIVIEPNADLVLSCPLKHAMVAKRPSASVESVAHTATVRGGFDVMIEANKSASWVLKKAGIVEYYCRFHPNMKGRITITPE